MTTQLSSKNTINKFYTGKISILFKTYYFHVYIDNIETLLLSAHIWENAIVRGCFSTCSKVEIYL